MNSTVITVLDGAMTLRTEDAEDRRSRRSRAVLWFALPVAGGLIAGGWVLWRTRGRAA